MWTERLQGSCRSRRERAGLLSDHVLHDRKMAIHRIELPRLKQQSVHLLRSEPRIGVDGRIHVDPIRPGLGHERIGLQLIEELLAFLVETLNLVRRHCRAQGLVGSI